jgi:hypothetical protein
MHTALVVFVVWKDAQKARNETAQLHTMEARAAVVLVSSMRTWIRMVRWDIRCCAVAHGSGHATLDSETLKALTPY